MDVNEIVASVRSNLDAKPGSIAEPARVADVLLYKVKGKLFAILSMRDFKGVSLKCDPHLAEILREQYEGVGHRYHLDRRHWISVSLDADIPPQEILRLADQSYDLVRSKLPRKDQTDLDG